MRKFGFLSVGLLMIGLLSTSGSVRAQDEESSEVTVHVIAPILDAEGTQIGMLAVATSEGATELSIMVEGLAEGEHGLHLHETGNCDPAGENTFSQAGGHFNPAGTTHPGHAGDLGNLVVDANGNALFLGGLGDATFDDGEFGLADADGTALVIHADPDDLATDPSGNSGARIACAVVSPPAA
ncbi:MAG: superoxide dismutase family protein [Thermomicrobiales bacterium]